MKIDFQKVGVGGLFLVLVLLPQTIFAATFSFKGGEKTIRIGDQFSVNVELNTEDEILNAIQGGLVLGPGLKPIQIRDGQSVVTIWNERPRVVSGKENPISFSGIMPGGYSGTNGLVFSVDLEATNKGDATLSLKDMLVLKNDGLGTNASVTSKLLTIFVEPKIGSSTVLDFKDTLPPEAFQPTVVSDPNIFDGRYFLIFQTVDKQSGIDRYEILEVKSGQKISDQTSSWQRIESPYELKDQSLRSDIYVRAVDRSGNFIVTEVPARYPGTFSGSLSLRMILFIITILFLILLLLWRGAKAFRKS